MIDQILAHDDSPVWTDQGQAWEPSHGTLLAIGTSREGRSIGACVVGEGPIRVNLVGGCHADEPVGPRLLNRLVRFLGSDDGRELRRLATWTIIPHVNPDGAVRNEPWQDPNAVSYDIGSFLAHRLRELPGDDIEFGFPRDAADAGARPENLAAFRFWKDHAPFHLHATLHGMSMAAGPWYLLEATWWDRFQPFAASIVDHVSDMGYELHDVERFGEKGFHRLAKGFCSRPDSGAMRDHFLGLGDEDMASRFWPSSMETIRSFGGDPLTLVSEMPLFILPGVGVELGPPDPVAVAWKERMDGWALRVAKEGVSGQEAVRAEAEEHGLRSMVVEDQMRLQWGFLVEGLRAVGADL